MSFKTLGAILFFGAILIFTIFCLYWYIPQITSNPQNGKIVEIAIWWAIGCGIFSTAGAILAKSK